MTTVRARRCRCPYNCFLYQPLKTPYGTFRKIQIHVPQRCKTQITHLVTDNGTSQPLHCYVHEESKMEYSSLCPTVEEFYNHLLYKLKNYDECDPSQAWAVTDDEPPIDSNAPSAEELYAIMMDKINKTKAKDRNEPPLDVDSDMDAIPRKH